MRLAAGFVAGAVAITAAGVAYLMRQLDIDLAGRRTVADTQAFADWYVTNYKTPRSRP